MPMRLCHPMVPRRRLRDTVILPSSSSAGETLLVIRRIRLFRLVIITTTLGRLMKDLMIMMMMMMLILMSNRANAFMHHHPTPAILGHPRYDSNKVLRPGLLQPNRRIQLLLSQQTNDNDETEILATTKNNNHNIQTITLLNSSSITTTTTTTETADAFLPPSNNDTISRTRSNNNMTRHRGGAAQSRRKPAFPKDAYRNLIAEEQNLRHEFISFTDQSITRSYTQSVRLVEPRTYARPDQFRKDMAQTPPCIDDVAEPPTRYGPLALFFAWNGIPARSVVALMAYWSFPPIVFYLEQRTVDLDALTNLVNDFLPGLAIVLGTYFSLTITILYDRFAKLQEVVNQEASSLAVTCRCVMDCFENDPERRIDATQAVADQVRTMIFDSRGKETLGVIYNDPYARLLNLVLKHKTITTPASMVDQELRSSIETLMTLRSRRMTYESMALAPTHFDVMTFLCGMLLVGYSLGTVASAQMNGVPTELAKVLFASLVVCYTLFYEMSFDLNRPFDGIYQIRRSGAAMHFLQIKHWIANDPVLAETVDFEEVLDKVSTMTVGCDGDCEKQKAKTWYN